MTRTSRWLALLVVFGVPGAASVLAMPDERPRGSLVIVGGGDRPEALMRRFVDLAGGPGKARVAVVPNASSEPEATGRELVVELQGLGAGAFVYHLTRAQAATDSAARQLDSVTGIWFSGGDQALVTDALAGSAALQTMQRRYHAGAVVGGTSAGAAIMSDSMITGDQTPPGDTTGYYGDEYPAIARRRVEIVPGLGFLQTAIVDQHFIRRERHNRLMSAVLERPTLLGVGIDESTALEVMPDGRWRILGESAVVIYDARQARVTGRGRPVLGAMGLRLHVVPAGGVFDPKTGGGSL